MNKVCLLGIFTFTICLWDGAMPRETSAQTAETRVMSLIRQDALYTMLPDSLFRQLGWDLPDKGLTIRQLTNAAPGGAVDPKNIEELPPEQIGYRAEWHVIRYPFYGLEWDITGLYMEPVNHQPGLPTLVMIHGGSSNWYTFYIAPPDHPSIAPYLAQKMPVLLITIPGNYKPGGWDMPIPQRQPAYLLNQSLDNREIRLRNAIFTFSLISEGVSRLIEQITTGPFLIMGHSTGGEIQFLLKDRFKDRMQGLSLGWGTGGPAALRRAWVQKAAAEHNRDITKISQRPVTEIRTRSYKDYARGYMGPMSPLLEEPVDNIYSWYFKVISQPDFLNDLAKKYFQAEFSRKAFFKQNMQDLEHRGRNDVRTEVETLIRKTAAESRIQVNLEAVMKDIFAPSRVNMTGYRKMIWTVGVLDEGHWDPMPENARELFVADQFRKENPDASIRVLVFETLLTHLGHMEKPKELAGALLTAIKWLYEDMERSGGNGNSP